MSTRNGGVPPLFVQALRSAVAHHAAGGPLPITLRAENDGRRPSVALRRVNVVELTPAQQDDAIALLATLMEGEVHAP
jgi:hypothetical protein